MNDIEARREFADELENHPLVERMDFTRDGYRTLLLELRNDGGETA